MKNVIVERVADFLKQHPPFQNLNLGDLRKIAGEVRVHYVPKRSFVFKEGDAAHTEFYVVQQGAVGLRSKNLSAAQWIDICDEGDILGLRPLFQNKRMPWMRWLEKNAFCMLFRLTLLKSCY
jgi:CBS domain-containing protein